MTEGEEIFFTHYVEYIDRRLRRFFVRLLIVFAILGLCMAAAVIWIDHVSDQNTRGLCAIRADSERRVALGIEFLKEHPKGFPGVSVDSLKRSTRNAMETVESLSFLDCSKY